MSYAYHIRCIIADETGMREECEIAISAPIVADDGMLEVTLICRHAFRTIDPRYAGDTAEEAIAHALNILRRNLRRNGRWLEDSEGKVIELPTPQAFCPSYPSDEEIDEELAKSR